MGYWTDWHLLNAADFGVSQLRPRVVCVALKHEVASHFRWPAPARPWHQRWSYSVIMKADSWLDIVAHCRQTTTPRWSTEQKSLRPHWRPTPSQRMGELLFDLMKADGWRGATKWRICRQQHRTHAGGRQQKARRPRLGIPTRARAAWANLGVDGRGVANVPPAAALLELPKLTCDMCAAYKAFPMTGNHGKNAGVYRQIGIYCFTLAHAVGLQILAQAIHAPQRVCIGP